VTAPAAAPRNIRFLTAAKVEVRPSRTCGLIVFQATDARGDSVLCELNPQQALDTALQVVAAIALLRGYPDLVFDA
jgi:hypothetical protein